LAGTLTRDEYLKQRRVERRKSKAAEVW
jgi:hypothetical protein